MKLLFIANSRLGDAILSTGILNYYLQHKESIKITVICSPLVAPLFNAFPRVSMVIAYKKEKRAGHWIRSWKEVDKGQWDLIIDLRNTLLSRILRKKNLLVFKGDKVLQHRLLSLSKLILDNKNILEPKIFINKKDFLKSNFILSKIKKSQPMIAISPSTNWKRKNWPIKKFAYLINKLTINKGPIPKAKIILLGSENDQKISLQLEKLLVDKDVLNLTGKINIMTVAAIIKKCKLFIGNDSGLMHLSAALGIKTVGLFGPSQDVIYRPWGKKCNFIRTPESYEDLVLVKGYDTNDPNTLMKNLDEKKVYDVCLDVLAL